MEPCLFPTLDYALEIRSDTLQTLTFLLANERESFDAFQSALGLSRWYEVLWALVLRLYTGNDTVAFRVQSRSCSGLAGEAPEDICSAEIFRFQSVSSIECCHRPLVSPEHDDPREAARRFNIKVIYGDQGHRQPYRFERTRKKRKLSQHALVERSPACARALPVDEGLLVSFEETLGRSWMHIRFNTTLYTERAVLNVGRTGRKIFQELLNDSNQLVGKIRSLSDDDLDQILAWNSGDLASLDSTLHGEISKHVKDRPDAPALHAWDGSLTYHELDTVTSNLQGHLCNLGPRIGEMVPVCFEKSLWAAVAMLGILKAGTQHRCSDLNRR